MAWLRRSPVLDAALQMIGPKAGDRVLLVGARDAGLAARVAAATGLNGSATVLLADESRRAEMDAAAGREGALIEIVTAPAERLPFDAGSLDLVVIDNAADDAAARQEVAAEALRVVRPGGRVIVVSGAKRVGLLRSFVPGPSSPTPGSPAIVSLLTRSGARAVRVLATLEGRTFVEGARGR